HTATFRDAAALGEVIISCTGGMHSMEALKSVGVEPLNGKILIDVSNPLQQDKDGIDCPWLLQHRITRRADSKSFPSDPCRQGAQHRELRHHDRAVARSWRSQLIHLWQPCRRKEASHSVPQRLVWLEAG